MSVLAWPGYVENGSTDEAVDWVKPFEDATRLQGHGPGLRHARTRRSACSRRTPRSSTSSRHPATRACGSSRAGYVEAVNVDLVPNYADVFPALKDKPYNTVDGVHYGVPHGRGVEPADVADRRRHAGADDSWAADVRSDVGVRRQGVGLRRPDLHRRCRRRPDGDEAGPRDQEPVRPGRQRSSRRPSICSSSRSR